MVLTASPNKNRKDRKNENTNDFDRRNGSYDADSGSIFES